MSIFIQRCSFIMRHYRLNPIIFLLLTLLLISSCSRTQIAYKFSDWFLLERMDNYFQTTSSQEDLLETKIDQLISWHRTHELPEIILTLTEFHKRYQDGLNPEDLDWLAEDHRSYLKRFVLKAVPDFSRFLATLDESQIQHFKTQLKSNDFLIKQADMTDEELERDTQDWFIDLMEDWFSSLNTEQKKNIRAWLKVEKSWIFSKLENRRKFQETFITLLKAHKTESEIETQLTVWIEKPESRWTPEFKSLLDQKIAQWKKLLFKVDATLTPAQRNRALEKIQGYIDDFKTLVI
jgi:Family of unknown function (DUF6279)